MVDTYKKFKVNLHLIEACNYRCRHCFAHFAEHNKLDFETWQRIIDNIAASGMTSAINFAGGEPFLYPGLTALAEYAVSLGLECSIVTNGSYISEEWIKRNASLFTTIGFSLDSFNEDTLIKIGRCDAKGNILSFDRVKNVFTFAKECNSDIKLKINTVVSALNKDEDFGEIIRRYGLSVDRWKILRMSYFENESFSNSDIIVTDREYEEYVSRNLDSLGIDFVPGQILYNADNKMEVVCENSLDGTYIMIDAGGYLVDNTKNSNYTRVIDCASTPFSEGLNKLVFKPDIYEARYK